MEQTADTKNEMLRRAYTEHKHIETECGILCPTCAEMSDWNYQWLGVVETSSCYNCQS